MHERQTIAGATHVEGIGLHSGSMIRMRLVPAEAGTGIVFVRTDLEGRSVRAVLQNAGPSFFATVLETADVRVSPEVPILDGSSSPFVEMILDTGLAVQGQAREYLNIVRPVILSDEDKKISVYPCKEYRVTYAIDFDHPHLGYQELTASLWKADHFRRKLAPARTFTFETEVETLRSKGLARGGSLDNAVVIGEHGLLNGSLRFEDEFVRHKMLDLTGDISLLGYPLRGHVIAYRAGHDLHGRLARKIWESTDSWYLAAWNEEPPPAVPSSVN
jgi:UDP-3-O-[3-hydroxymyristoyl] N-acetylglucosamine deacetylase